MNIRSRASVCRQSQPLKKLVTREANECTVIWVLRSGTASASLLCLICPSLPPLPALISHGKVAAMQAWGLQGSQPEPVTGDGPSRPGWTTLKASSPISPVLLFCPFVSAFPITKYNRGERKNKCKVSSLDLQPIWQYLEKKSSVGWRRG